MNILQRYWWYHKLKGTSYQAIFAPYSFHDKMTNEYVSLDCETTSLDPNRAEIVTIAATKIVGNRILISQSFEVKLRAPHSLDAGSIKIHKIRHNDLIDGIGEQEAILQLIDFIGNRPLVGYHIRYDKKILDIACKRHFGFPLPNKLIEVSQIYHDQLERRLPNAYFDLSLEAICHQLNLPLQNKHDALQDAITAALVFVRLTHGDLPEFHLNPQSQAI
ncbi:DNA polymerase III subunit epsilon [Vibrio sp. 10N.286.49.B3]|uniref:3'-5' exonuclease n=1 Tax=Vibrio sp. 10N.286.49.B3 TaxID=1880855 RepID=UPI000C841524|nr:3'-5' exonuclease [Vibrio sp. 10N.286.49.B3]PMH46235.1 DNA polymerase III subunit epsilon [Vibrio sp. 10N.286.49.B3]